MSRVVIAADLGDEQGQRIVSFFSARALRAEGHAVEWLDGDEAAEAVTSAPPDLLIVSDELPRQDWQAVARAARAASSGVRLLRLSWYKGPSSGNPYILATPFSMRMLKARVAEVMALPPAKL